jgi:glycosyltransferase involved in cell wall biosynthesis
MCKVSVIIPVYNTERFIEPAIESVLAQSFTDYEVLIIDDGSSDSSIARCLRFEDVRLKIIRQSNRGLAGARNTGIRRARGEYVAFLDADDLWEPDKLARHVAHLDACPEVGVSFSRSRFIDEQGSDIGLYQMPKLHNISAVDVLLRNPVGNGSAPVIRRQVFEDIGFASPAGSGQYTCYFDEELRQSEDIECWVRIATTSVWRIEGLPEPLSRYRVNAGGLSADLWKQLKTWERAIRKMRAYAPTLLKNWETRARAFQYRYLARRALRMRQPKTALRLLVRALQSSPGMLVQEPTRTLVTLGSAVLMAVLPGRLYPLVEQYALRSASAFQLRNINATS